MRSRRVPAAVAAFAILVSACGDDSSVPGAGPVTTSPVTTSPVTTSPADADFLAGTSWVAQRISDGDVDSPVIAGGVPTIEFGPNGRSVSGSTGCNRYSGEAVVGPGTIAVSDVAVTERACLEPGVMDQEALFLDILTGADTFTLADGTLELRASAGSVTFVAPEPIVEVSLDETFWTLDGLVAGDAVTSVLTTTTPSLRVDVDAGTLQGTTGCNDFSGEVRILGEQFTVSELSNTEIACEPQVMDQEAFILDVLRNVQLFDIDEDRLMLFTGEGRGLLYRAG